MPELPEVETIRRQLESDVVGHTLVAADTHPSEKFTPALEAVGQRIECSNRRGKYLLFGLDDGEELIVHLGMTGSLRVVPGHGDDPSCESHDRWTRAVWRLDDGRDLVFRDVRRFGRLRVVLAGDYQLIPTLRDMGPEPLESGFDGKVLHANVQGSRRAIKTQLLSQRPVAGVGNIYADEALFAAGIDPRTTRVGRTRCDRLATAIVDALSKSLDNGGTTLRDYVDAEGRSGTNQHDLAVYGRAGEPCASCGTTLRSCVLDARSTTYCPTCQRR